jgi:hypothetical protein
MCPIHASKTIANDEIMEDKTVFRKVWINRDEIKQIQESVEHTKRSFEMKIFFF